MRLLPAFAAFGVLIAAASSAAAQHLPWKHGDQPPALAGFRLSDLPDSARARLGPGVTIDSMGDGGVAVAYTSAARGVSIITTRPDGVAIIYVTSRDAGMLDSVRVGDSRERVLQRWGNPSVANGSTALWSVDDWVIVVELGEGDKIARLGVGRKA